jgi:POT family proton-dependent oligopeptide transporter
VPLQEFFVANFQQGGKRVILPIFRKYPPGFGGLFITQACFNFSFYGLKSIFLLYVIGQFSLSEAEGISLFATLMVLSYGSSLVGGWIADNSLGTKMTIILGGLLQTVGIFGLMFSSQDVCSLSLALISLGSGFFKPTLSTSVGMLFEDPRDPQKDKAYSTFYMAMNLGSFAAPLLCGFVSKTYGGYHNSFLLIIITLLGGVYLSYETRVLKQKKESLAFQNTLFSHPLFVISLTATLLTLLYLIFKHQGYFSHLMGVVILASLCCLGKVFSQATPQERRDITDIVLYVLLFTVFSALFEQAGSSLMLFFNKAVEHRIMGIEFPPAILLSLGPIFVLICSPFLILFSEKILEKKTPIDGLIKVGVGFILTGLSFFVLAFSCTQEDGLISPFWIIGAIFIQTVGELWIVPIGFSNVSKLAPPRFRSFMMSLWLMAIAYGHHLGGFIAQFSLADSSVVENSLSHYHTFFLNLALIPCVIALLLFLVHYIRQRTSNPSKELSKAVQ